eukprot:jgi/Botrbrau1/3824/Bobra.0183s0053.1
MAMTHMSNKSPPPRPSPPSLHCAAPSQWSPTVDSHSQAPRPITTPAPSHYWLLAACVTVSLAPLIVRHLCGAPKHSVLVSHKALADVLVLVNTTRDAPVTVISASNEIRVPRCSISTGPLSNESPTKSTTELQSPRTEPQPSRTEPQSPRTELQSPRTELHSPGTEPQFPGTEPQSPGTEAQSPRTEPQSPQQSDTAQPTGEQARGCNQDVGQPCARQARNVLGLQENSVRTAAKVPHSERGPAKLLQMQLMAIDGEPTNPNDSSVSSMPFLIINDIQVLVIRQHPLPRQPGTSPPSSFLNIHILGILQHPHYPDSH